jgi:type VI protein secretion system component Hcp
MRHLVLAVAIPLVLAGACSAVAEEKKHFEVQDYGFGVSMPVTTSRSSGSTGKAMHNDLTIQKQLDASSPRLFQQSKSPTTTANPSLQGGSAVGAGSRR